jgi:hypothetical protein
VRFRTRGRGTRAAAIAGAIGGAFLVFAIWAGAASAANGSLEICKSGLNGAAGQTFKIAYQKGSTGAQTTVTVTGGSCNAAISVPIGTYILTEDLTSGQWVMSGDNVTPSSAWVSDNVRRGIVKVTVTANQETQAEFVNSPAGATVKVCKWSASPALQGAQYSFNVNGQTVIAAAGKNAANAGCSTALSTFPGTRLKIQESVPSGETVASVTFNGASVSSTAGLVKVTATTGANVVVFEDEPLGPPQTGYIEVCKDAGDEYVAHATDPFTFTITDKTGFQDTENVLVGQCSGPIKVAAGNVTVAETQNGNTFVSDISTVPDPNALGPTNKVNGTATVVVPVAADSTGEVQVHFVNKTVTAQLKICKYLTAGSDSLAGQSFTFTITDDAGVQRIRILASAGANGACRNVLEGDGIKYIGTLGEANDPLLLPVGSTVTVTEDLAGFPYVSGDGNARGADDVQTATVVAGINTISFHNQALGQLEICKAMLKAQAVDDTVYNDKTVFHFAVDGAKSGALSDIQVAAGHCSNPIIVNAGSHTVNENLSKTPGFQFVSSTATGPTGDNRVLSGTNPVTVSVPYFGDATNGGETLVTFTNKVQRASIKICKLIDPGSQTPIGGLDYSFQTSVNGGVFGEPVTVHPPYPGSSSCTGVLLNVPVVKPDGTPSTITVQEVQQAAAEAQSITVQNGTVTGTDLAAGSVTFTPGVGINIVTYTNTVRCSGAEAMVTGTPGSDGFAASSAQAVAFGCAVYVVTGGEEGGVIMMVPAVSSVLQLEFIRGANTGTAIPIGLNGVNLSDIGMGANGVLYGIARGGAGNFQGPFYTVNKNTGLATLVGYSGDAYINSLVGDPNAARQFGADNFTLSPPQIGCLVTINQASGSGSGYANDCNIGYVPSGDLAFSTNGTLFLTALHSAATDRLVTLNLSTSNNWPTPIGTVVGDIGVPGVDGLVSSFNELFGFTTKGVLLKISMTSGAGTVLATGGPEVYGAASPTQNN